MASGIPLWYFSCCIPGKTKRPGILKYPGTEIIKIKSAVPPALNPHQVICGSSCSLDSKIPRQVPKNNSCSLGSKEPHQVIRVPLFACNVCYTYRPTLYCCICSDGQLPSVPMISSAVRRSQSVTPASCQFLETRVLFIAFLNFNTLAC